MDANERDNDSGVVLPAGMEIVVPPPASDARVEQDRPQVVGRPGRALATAEACCEEALAPDGGGRP